jgi:hypothetical protein
MKNKKTNKKRKNGPIEDVFIKILPFSAKTTKTLLVIISIANLSMSAFFFTETISKLENSKDLSQIFQIRSENTISY